MKFVGNQKPLYIQSSYFKVVHFTSGAPGHLCWELDVCGLFSSSTDDFEKLNIEMLVLGVVQQNKQLNSEFQVFI